MSFYSPGPAFPAVAAIVNYRSPLPAAAAAAAVAAAGGAVPLPQPPPPPPPLVATPLPVPVPVLESPQRTKVDGPAAPSPGPAFSSGPTPTTAGTPDPVTKAVMDNIMGKLPTKKQPTSCKCEVCGLEFSGQVVLETHLAGAKHAKKVKSQEILRQLQNSGQTFSRDEKTKILKCEVCDVVVNSSQQLQTHLAGNKHKQKVLKKVTQGSGQGKSPIGLNSNNVIGSHTPVGADIQSDANGNAASAPMDTCPSPRDIPAAAAAASSAAGGEGAKEVDGETEADGGGGGGGGGAATLSQRASKYFCDTCNVSLNSEIQLEQHLGSRKHKERSANGGKSRPRPAPYWKKPRASPFGNGGVGGKRAGVGAAGAVAAAAAGGGKLPGPSLPFTQPLSSTFVSGGSMM